MLRGTESGLRKNTPILEEKLQARMEDLIMKVWVSLVVIDDEVVGGG